MLSTPLARDNVQTSGPAAVMTDTRIPRSALARMAGLFILFRYMVEKRTEKPVLDKIGLLWWWYSLQRSKAANTAHY